MSADHWKCLRQYEFRSTLITWLTVVAVRYFQNKTASEQTKTTQTTPLYSEAQNVPDHHDIIDELSRLELYEAIEKLPKPRERMALLGELAGKKAELIAEEMGCTVAAVYNLVKKAKMTLKKNMKGVEK